MSGGGRGGERIDAEGVAAPRSLGDIGEAATLPADEAPRPSSASRGSLDLPRPELDGPLDAVEQARVFEALFEVPARPRLLGRYVVLGTLGSGGMGVVLEAFDRTLDRRVAVKVLHKEIDERQTARLLREAQAMAKLSHPNVVQVFEAGEVDGQTFVVMELVKGKTLREWMRREPRPSWQECVEVFWQAGKGLAAAHARGLVHRDFKPGNAIVDEEGRPRVLDFGLARKVDDKREEQQSSITERVGTDASAAALDTLLTSPGAVLGTPAYMPPEQMKGAETDARSDQFSFCVALHEAVYGERPFEGGTMMALMVSMTVGEVRPAPKGTNVPTKLRAVLLRGLSIDPGQRWPSMEDLLAELHALVAPRGHRWKALGLTAGLVGLGVAVAIPQLLAFQERCTGAESQLDGIWDDARRQRVRDAVLGTKLSYAPDTWERIEPALDDYARAWVGKHTESCEATTVRGEQTEEAMDLRMSCLHDRKVALAAAVSVLADANDTVVERAVALVEALPSMDPCDDLNRLEQLRERVPPPEDPLVREEVDALREQLAGVRAELEAGRPADALEHVEPLVQRASALGYGPVLAEALAERGKARDETDRFVEAERDLGQAFTLAAEHGHDVVAVNAVNELIWVVGYRQARHERGLGWGDTALALALGPDVQPTAEARALSAIGSVLIQQGKMSEALTHYERALAIEARAPGPNHAAIATLQRNIGNVLAEQGKPSEALTHYERALAIREQALGNNHTSVAFELGNIGSVLREQGKLSEALTYQQRALTIFERALGKDHTSVAMVRVNIGGVLSQQGKLSEALTQFQAALPSLERALGKDHTSVAGVLVNIGGALAQQGKLSEALTQEQRALAIYERALGKDHASVATVLVHMGNMLFQQGKHEEALDCLRRTVAIYERALGPEHPQIAYPLSTIGDILRGQGKNEEARVYHERALAISEKALGPDHLQLANDLVGLAEVALDQRDFEAARAHAERAVSIREASDVAPHRLAEARFLLARTLWNDPTEHARARELAEQARVGFVEQGSGLEGPLAAVEAWLAEHPPVSG